MDQRKSSDVRAISPLYMERGLFAVRYVSTPETVNWPVAQVFVPAELDGKVRLVAAPGVEPGVLAGPGSCCVVVNEIAGVLRIGLRPAQVGGSLEASIKVEQLELASLADVSSAPIAGREQARSPVAPIADLRPQQSDAPSIKMIAHISRRGDAEIVSGTWAAGPSAPASIEGIEIRELGQSAPGIEIQVLNAGSQQRWSPWVRPGNFAGTKGRAQALVGIRFRLTGPQAEHWALSAEAMFLGSPIVQREGSEIELVGPFGADPMVGLRLALKAAASSAAPKAPSVNQGRDPRIKVFRTGGARR